jgi:twitching motility two-component system response regulator PilH
VRVLKKILIVDDSQASIRMMESMLGPEGYSSVSINDPTKIEQAIDSEQPSVILLDVVMPERNGFQICRDLKGHAEYGKIPVILVTSKSSASDKFWGQEQGADGYVTKPFTREDLLRAVRRFA